MTFSIVTSAIVEQLPRTSGYRLARPDPKSITLQIPGSSSVLFKHDQGSTMSILRPCARAFRPAPVALRPAAGRRLHVTPLRAGLSEDDTHRGKPPTRGPSPSILTGLNRCQQMTKIARAISTRTRKTRSPRPSQARPSGRANWRRTVRRRYGLLRPDPTIRQSPKLEVQRRLVRALTDNAECTGKSGSRGH